MKHRLMYWVFVCLASTVFSLLPANAQTVRINTGGTQFTDSQSAVWSADTSFSGGDTYASAAPIAGSVDDALYQSERYGSSFSYHVPIANGTYQVTLKFAEIYFTSAGQRKFSVTAEGNPVVTNLDIFAQAGANTAYDIVANVPVNDGALDLSFVASINNAKISAIQIKLTGPPVNAAPTVNAGPDQSITLPQNSVNLSGTASDDGLPNPPAAFTTTWSFFSGPGSVTFGNVNALQTTATFTTAGTYTLRLTGNDSALTSTDDVTVVVNPAGTPTGTTLRINAGGPQFTDSFNAVWSADSNFTGGSAYTAASPIAGTTDDTLYQSEHWGSSFAYHLPVTNGNYLVTLKFAEIYFNAAGKRKFNVSAEGSPIVTNLDIFAQAGANTAYDVASSVTVNDGTLDLVFTGVVDNAKVSAIYIQPTNGPPVNAAPVISAGPDQTTTLPQNSINLNGNASDDGFPNPPATLTTTWSKVSGPGTVSFGNTNLPQTTAAFSVAGTYTLRLTGNDSALSTTDDIVVTVNPPGPPSGTTLRINDGGPQYTDSQSAVWVSDTNIGGTGTYTTAASISGTPDQTLYQSERWGGNFSLHFPVTNGSYLVTLKFAEIYFNVAGARKFSVSAEGSQIVANLDIFAQAGKNTAYDITTPVNVGDGSLDLTFISTIDNAKINAIFIRPNPASQNAAPIVSAGTDKTITLPQNTVALNGSATDDGMPNPPGALTTTWSVVSGPGVVSFGDINAANTTAMFSQSGAYTLRFTGDDGAIAVPSDVFITVNPAPATSDPDTARFNCGGPTFTDSSAFVWTADNNFTPSGVYSTSSPIAGTLDDPLFQTERWGSNFSYNVPVPNGSYDVVFHFAEIYFSALSKRVFDVSLQGQKVITALDIFSKAGALNVYSETHQASVSNGMLNIHFVSLVDNAKCSAIEIRPSGNQPPHLLHVVVNAPTFVVDDDGNGSETVTLDGSFSHTHEIGRHIVGYTWAEQGATLGTAKVLTGPFALGPHTVSLTIQDDDSPPKTLAGYVSLPVYPLNSVGGVQADYYPTGATPVGNVIDSLNVPIGFKEVLQGLQVLANASTIGGSPYATNVVIDLKGKYNAAQAGSYQFTETGPSTFRIFVDGTAVNGPVSLTQGKHSIEVRFGVSSTSDLPAEVQVAFNGQPAAPVSLSDLDHDETTISPFINSMPGTGSENGGETIVIQGVGFYPKTGVTVHFGGVTLSGAVLTLAPGTITFPAPPGTGTKQVTVQTPGGTSNSVPYVYTGGPAIAFTNSSSANLPSPTSATWGPDGRLYVGSVGGTIMAITFDDNYNVLSSQTVHSVESLSNSNVLGIGFNPFDPPSPPRLYIAHSHVFQHGGSCFTGSSIYEGQISHLDGPQFNIVNPYVTELPQSNHDHGVSGFYFDNAGDLMATVGGNTSAGVAACAMGGLPETPLSAAVVKVLTSKPGFNGNAFYLETATGNSNDDQVFGDTVDLGPGVDIAPYYLGFRNTYDIVLTTSGRTYLTENGPNAGFGPASTSATTEGPDPEEPDEMNFAVEGHYYGHPNRNRGRYDDRQNVYHPPTDPPIFGLYTPPLHLFPSSTDGIDEYRATTFGSAMRGNILAQQWNGSLFRVVLSQDGRSVSDSQTMTNMPTALDILAGPGGAIISPDYQTGNIYVSLPSDTSGGTKAYDIFPWRALPTGNVPFVIGGTGFGTLQNTTVLIGSASAQLTSVSPTRIHGTIPANANPTPDLLDVAVTTGGQTSTITSAFRYVFNAGQGKGLWARETAMPISLGEVAAGISRGILYLVGEDGPQTLAFDLATGAWKSDLAIRPFIGDHHAAEVIDNKLYLFGGLGAEGKVQIYDPVSDSWSLGASCPIASGSASTALIGGKVYYAGGIVGSTTTSQAAVYDPKLDSWSMIAPMPLGRNHAASSTDGKKMYVFGGRGNGSGDGNVVAIGFDDTQVYDPATNTWACNSDGISSLAPLPQARGGMGKAVYFRGEFYVMGGETTSEGTGQVAGNVYERVDVYNPVTNTWRLDSPMITARHGIFPLLLNGSIFVAGGGPASGHTNSAAVEYLSN